jgi:hypothetical protein
MSLDTLLKLPLIAEKIGTRYHDESDSSSSSEESFEEPPTRASTKSTPMVEKTSDGLSRYNSMPILTHPSTNQTTNQTTRPPRYKSATRSMTDLGERERHFREMTEQFDDYVDHCKELHAWITPKEVMKNTDRFSLLKAFGRNRRGIKHSEITDDSEFVESLSRMEPTLAKYSSLCRTLLDMPGWTLTPSILQQLNWFEENDTTLENLCLSMDKEISQKMNKSHRENVKKTIKQCRQILLRIKTYASIIKTHNY